MECCVLGGMFGVKFINNAASVPSINAKAFKKFHNKMLSQGIYLPPSAFEACFLSFAHQDIDIEQTCQAIKTTFAVWHSS